MSGYSPPRRWPDPGRGFREAPPVPHVPENNNFCDMGYLEDPMINGGAGPPHGFHGHNRDFQRAPYSPGSGASKWNPGYFNNNFRPEPPPRGPYNKWIDHGNNSPRFSDHSNGSPRLSDSEHGRMDGLVSPSMKGSPFGGRRRRGELNSRGNYHRYFDQYSQQDRVPEIDRIPGSYDQSPLNDGFNYDYHHGAHESTQGDLLGEEHDSIRGREHYHRGFRGKRGIYPPHGFPSPRGDDRKGTPSFQSPRNNPYNDSYSSPILNSSTWSPTYDSPDSPLAKSYLKERGSPHSFGANIEDMQRRLASPAQQNYTHHSRVHETTGGLVRDNGPILHASHGQIDPRRKGGDYAATDFIKSDTFMGNSVPHMGETGDFSDMRDPRLRKSIHKHHIQRHGSSLCDVVSHDHWYCKAEVDENENISFLDSKGGYTSTVITTSLASSFLTVVEKRPKHSLSKFSSMTTGLKLSEEGQSSSSQLPSARLALPKTGPKSILSRSNLLSNVPKEVSMDNQSLEHEGLNRLNSSEITIEDRVRKDNTEIDRVQTSGGSVDVDKEKGVDEVIVREEKNLNLLVFSLNDFDLDLDSEPSSSEDEMYCSPAHSVASMDEESSRSPQWAIMKNDLGKLLRLAKVDATSMGTGINGRSTPVKLATYASKSSPVVARNRNLMKGNIKRKRRRNFQRKVVVEAPNSESNEQRTSVVPGDDESDRCADFNLESSSTETLSSGLLNSRRAQRKKSLPSSAEDQFEETELANDGSERRSKRQQRTFFEEFKPEVLSARSRTETATLRRRIELEKEIERNEFERLQTAVDPHDDLESSSSVSYSLDQSFDDSSALSVTSSSMQSSVVEDPSQRLSSLEDFDPEVVASAKKFSFHKFSGDTPLHRLCRSGKYANIEIEIARYMIVVQKVAVNHADHAGWTPLHEATQKNRLAMADFLMKSGADPNLASIGEGVRPLHDAIESGFLDMVKLLVQSGADPTAERGQQTPLEIALEYRQFEIYNFLEAIIEARTKHPASGHKEPSEKEEHSDKAGKLHVYMSVKGYRPDCIDFGEELNYPLFYVTPIIELSDCPFLPVYNFKISSGPNPRRHNFHLVTDILNTLDLTEEMLLQFCDQVHPVEYSVREVLDQVTSENCHKLSESIAALPLNNKLKFLPLCKQLRDLLDITVENMDD